MGNYAPITIVGNITQEPELKFTKSGAAVLHFSLAYTPRKKDASGAWVDSDESYFYEVNVWNSLAEAASTSLAKGQRVIVMGDLKQSYWLADDGTKRRKHFIEASEVGVSPRFADLTYTKRQKGAINGGGNSSFQPQQNQQGGFSQAAQNIASSFGQATPQQNQQQSPWNQPQQGQQQGFQQQGFGEQPPF